MHLSPAPSGVAAISQCNGNLLSGTALIIWVALAEAPQLASEGRLAPRSPQQTLGAT
jgi:hypothetical protein